MVALWLEYPTRNLSDQGLQSLVLMVPVPTFDNNGTREMCRMLVAQMQPWDSGSSN